MLFLCVGAHITDELSIVCIYIVPTVEALIRIHICSWEVYKIFTHCCHSVSIPRLCIFVHYAKNLKTKCMKINTASTVIGSQSIILNGNCKLDMLYIGIGIQTNFIYIFFLHSMTFEYSLTVGVIKS